MKADILVAGNYRPALDDKQVNRMPLTAEASAAVFTRQAELLGLRTAVHVPGDFPCDNHPPDELLDGITDALLSRAVHLHIHSYCKHPYLQQHVPEVFERARSMHMTLSLSLHWDGRGSLDFITELLPQLSVFLPNEKEALALTGAGDVEQAISQLSSIPIVAVKLEGGAMLRAGTKTVHLAAPQVESENSSAQSSGMETESLGTDRFFEDSFDAGVLYGYLKGWPLQRTLELAAACSSLTQQASQISNLPDMQTALEYIHAGSDIDNAE